MEEVSADKDTISGHWEMAGLPVLHKFGHFKPDYPSFPEELIDKICTKFGIDGILGNKAASGTVIIQELGEEHLKTGKPIFYTSADSNIQIAAHEEQFGLERLYQLCEIAYEEVKPYNIGRVIARPFVGQKNGEFVRTKNRHDYALTPFEPTILDKAKEKGLEVTAIGKIRDIYAGSGVTRAVKASGLKELWDVTLEEIKLMGDKDGIVFTNFVDFDMEWGHRRDVKGYAEGLMYFDKRLPDILEVLNDDDVVFITADHGCDPTYKGTDHTRECVPVLMFGKNVKAENIGRRGTYADIAATIADKFNLEIFNVGKSFL
jgi:phosphopentomutase